MENTCYNLILSTTLSGAEPPLRKTNPNEGLKQKQESFFLSATSEKKFQDRRNYCSITELLKKLIRPPVEKKRRSFEFEVVEGGLPVSRMQARGPLWKQHRLRRTAKPHLGTMAEHRLQKTPQREKNNENGDG